MGDNRGLVPPIIRFLKRIYIDPCSDCWIWTGAFCSDGYGTFRVNGKTVGAHRWKYEQIYGPVKKGLELDHICNKRACVKPSHLEPVTHRENVRRGKASERLKTWLASKTHCPKGHPYDKQNTYNWKGTGRSCKTCRRELHAKYQKIHWRRYRDNWRMKRGLPPINRKPSVPPQTDHSR